MPHALQEIAYIINIYSTAAYLDIKGLENNPQFTRAPSQNKSGLSRQRGYTNVDDANAARDGDDKKRPLDVEMDDDEEHEPKKSRTEGDASMESDVDADESMAPKRGSKRGLREEDVEELSSSKKARGKRARKGPTDADHSMDVDVDDEEADEVSELPSTARGKKRDRAEAGSTFGGDDDESADEIEVDGHSKARRRRKRRTVAKRKSEASYLRSKMGDEEATEASSPDQKAVRTKRGKRASHVAPRGHDDIKDDVSMDGSTTSNRSKVRSVGDEWESNGIRYKIGPNYQRLRQALVKKERQKFLMVRIAIFFMYSGAPPRG